MNLEGRPRHSPEADQTAMYDERDPIDLDAVPLSGGVLVKALALSIDPYLRGLMREPDVSLYGISYLRGQPIFNTGIGRVLRSEVRAFKVGDHITGMLDFQEYNIITSERISAGGYQAIVKAEPSLPWTVYLGAAALTGRTAFLGYKELIKPNLKTGGVMFVTLLFSSQNVILKVIASAGSDDKRLLKQEGPIDFYWDNVGGATLDAVLSCMSTFGRVVSCGMASIYNDGMQGYNFQHLWDSHPI
ncbi:chaperonin 10-like protein [Mucidula mucida]|nr:chaperonin 10-like protein [Mucidula mucida]